MKPSTSDIVEVNQILSLWGHLLDKRQWDRFGEVFAEDAFYDCSVFGFASVSGLEAIRTMLGHEGHALAHHSTNVFVQEGPGDGLLAESKGLGLLAGGAAASVTYSDTLARTPSGWRLTSRILALQPSPH